MADVSQNVDGVEVETVFSTTSSSGSHRASGDLGHLITSNTNEAVSDDALVKALQDITCNLDENGLKKATELYSGNGNENNMNPKVKDLQNGDGDTDSNLANLLDNHNGSSSSTDMVSELFKELPDCQLQCLKEDGYVAAISVCIGILKQHLGVKYEKYESVCKSFFNGVTEQDVYDEEIRECLTEEAYEYHNQLVFCILKDALNIANTDSSETLAENTDFTAIFKLFDGKTPLPAPRSRDNVSVKSEVKVESQDDDDDEVVMIKKSKRKKPNRIIDDEDDEDETTKEAPKVPRWSSVNDAISQDTSASGTKRKKRKLMIYSDDEDEPDAAFDTLSFHSNANNDDDEEEEEEVVKRIDVKSTGLLKTTLTISRNPARDSTTPNSSRNGKNIKSSSSILDQLLSSDKPISLLPSISATNAKSALQSSQTTLDSYIGKPPLPTLNNKKDVQPKGNSSSTTNAATTNITKNTLAKSSLLKQSLTSTIQSTNLKNGNKNTVKRQKTQNSIQVNNVSSISNSSDNKSGTSLLSKKVPPVKFPENAKIKQLLKQTLCSTKQQAATASQPSNSSTETSILRLDINDKAKNQEETPSLINGTNGEVRNHHNEIEAYNISKPTYYDDNVMELINPLREPDESFDVEERFVGTLLKPTMYSFEQKELKRGSLDQCGKMATSLLPKGVVPPVKLEEDVKPPSDMYLEVTSMETSALVNQFGSSDLLPSALNLGHRISQVCLLHDIKMVDKRVFDVATHSLRKLLKNIISRMIAARSSSSMKRSPSDEFTSNLDAELYPKNPPALFRKLVERQVRQSDRRKYGTLKNGLTFSRLDQATFNAKEKMVISLYRPNSGPLYTPEEQPAIYDKEAGVRFFYYFLKNNRALVPVHGVWSRAVRRAAVALDNLEEGEEADGTSMPFNHRSIAQL